jgi:glutamate N-acetyltransferase/amino-acid N-acetyltransferase
MTMNVLPKKGAITMPQGFLAAAVDTYIKRKDVLDLAMVYSVTKARAAAVFTTNKVKAWPVLLDQEFIKKPYHRALFVNSGNANCCNGIKNKAKFIKAHELFAKLLGVNAFEIFSSSTGVIGRDFPIACILDNAEKLVDRLSKKEGHRAARAILTTDTRTKEAVVSFRIKGKDVKLAAMGKGAGMLHPNMATMLVFMTTDCNISKPLLQTALSEVTEKTFNRISVDNDMSTNDTVLIFANGASGHECIKKKDKSYYLFFAALEKLSMFIAKELVRDGEGVTKICNITIRGAKNEKQATRAARTIANSMLFKTALHGADPNWGRIVSALGASHDVQYSFEKLMIAFDNTSVLKNGKPCAENIVLAKKAMSKKEVFLTIDLGVGTAQSHFITSDLTKEYISINADYTT